MVDNMLMMSHNDDIILKNLAGGNIGGLPSKWPICQNKFPPKFYGHTVN